MSRLLPLTFAIQLILVGCSNPRTVHDAGVTDDAGTTPDSGEAEDSGCVGEDLLCDGLDNDCDGLIDVGPPVQLRRLLVNVFPDSSLVETRGGFALRLALDMDAGTELLFFDEELGERGPPLALPKLGLNQRIFSADDDSVFVSWIAPAPGDAGPPGSVYVGRVRADGGWVFGPTSDGGLGSTAVISARPDLFAPHFVVLSREGDLGHVMWRETCDEYWYRGATIRPETGEVLDAGAPILRKPTWAQTCGQVGGPSTYAAPIRDGGLVVVVSDSRSDGGVTIQPLHHFDSSLQYLGAEPWALDAAEHWWIGVLNGARGSSPDDFWLFEFGLNQSDPRGGPARGWHDGGSAPLSLSVDNSFTSGLLVRGTSAPFSVYWNWEGSVVAKSPGASGWRRIGSVGSPYGRPGAVSLGNGRAVLAVEPNDGGVLSVLREFCEP